MLIPHWLKLQCRRRQEERAGGRKDAVIPFSTLDGVIHILKDETILTL